MLDYNDLNEEEKRRLREKLGISRIHEFYLEDKGILLMNANELFEYIYLLNIKKVKDVVNLIKNLTSKVITTEDVNKTIQQKLIESNEKVYKLGNDKYMYNE